MTPDQQLFESTKYGHRVLMLVPLHNQRFGLTGADRQLISMGTLEELAPLIHAHKPPPPLARQTSTDLLKTLEF